MTSNFDIRQLPEFNVAIFSFLLNFVWEMWQAPFYEGLTGSSHWEGIVICSRATFGDVGIAILAYYIVTIFSGSRNWVSLPQRWEQLLFIGVGIAVTVVIEALATGPMARWSYGSLMPTVPLLGTGLLPMLQWLAIPPLVLWFVRRQLHGYKGQRNLGTRQ